jgi:hypothetical protein
VITFRSIGSAQSGFNVVFRVLECDFDFELNEKFTMDESLRTISSEIHSTADESEMREMAVGTLKHSKTGAIDGYCRPMIRGETTYEKRADGRIGQQSPDQ